MRYERTKEVAAVLSMVSVGVTISVAAISSASFTFGVTVSALIAGVAALFSIVISHRLDIERERHRIFLIYAREDLEQARTLVSDLRKHGFKLWLDVEEIKPGQVWQIAAMKALEESAAALVLISPHFEKKGFVQEELKVALDTLQARDREVSPVIPVRLDEKTPIPEKLSHIQWVNLFESGASARLVEGLKLIVRNNVKSRTSQAGAT